MLYRLCSFFILCPSLAENVLSYGPCIPLSDPYGSDAFHVQRQAKRDRKEGSMLVFAGVPLRVHTFHHIRHGIRDAFGLCPAGDAGSGEG